ncbi:MAG: ferritin-like domain-containing protein [Actinomycetota bacterium]
MDNEVTQSGVDNAQGRVLRRSIIGAGLGGAALSLLPFLGGRAAATDTTATGGSAETTTTTAPPLRPTADDTALLGQAQQLEIAARRLYAQALTDVKWTPEQQRVVATISQQHIAFAGSLSGLLGRNAPNAVSDQIVGKFASGFTGDAKTVLATAWQLESAVVATHLDVLAKLQGINGAALIASMMVTEARNCTVVAELASISDNAKLLVDTEEPSLLGNG